MKQMINNVISDISAEEETKINALNEKANADRDVKFAEEEAKETLKASAKAKLIAGEPLTQEEADTIVL